MENRNNLLVVFLIAIAVLISWGLTNDFIRRSAPEPPQTNICKEDSLQKVIYTMQIDMETLEDGFDSKERRYENILFEYEFGIDRLKNYQPEAYKEFHRIISHKEYYSHEDERENIKRLNIKDEYNR